MASEGVTESASEGVATPATLSARLRADPSPATLQSVVSDLLKSSPTGYALEVAERFTGSPPATDPEEVELTLGDVFMALLYIDPENAPMPTKASLVDMTRRYIASARTGGRRPRNFKFDRCVKTVRKTVKARKGSNKESAAIAICVTSVLHPKGRTLKRYRKGRLLTQKKR